MFRVSRSLDSVKCDVLCVKGTRNTVHNVQGQDRYSFGCKSDVCIRSRKYIAAI
jgi:hypothetical protein